MLFYCNISGQMAEQAQKLTLKESTIFIELKELKISYFTFIKKSVRYFSAIS